MQIYKTNVFPRALLAIPLLGTLALLSQEVQAQSRQSSTSRTKAKQPSLEARLQKARTIYLQYIRAADASPVFTVSGKVERGDYDRLTIYGTSTPFNAAAQIGLGQNAEDSFLTVYRTTLASITNGRFEGLCILISQREFTPVPEVYLKLLSQMQKYRDLTRSLQAQIDARENVKIQAARKREQARVAQLEASLKAKAAQVEATKQAQRDSTFRARLVLAQKETADKLAELNRGVALLDDKGAAYTQSSALAMAQFNKWADLGISQRVLLERTFDDLAHVIIWQVERGDWPSTSTSVERLLTLQLDTLPAKDAQTGRERTKLQNDTNFSEIIADIMRPGGKERATVTRLAKVWLENLPGYIASSAPQGDKVKVAGLSQYLGSRVFAPNEERTRIIATALDAVRGEYGPSVLTVSGDYTSAVEAAKRLRVARQVQTFQPADTFNDTVPPVIADTEDLRRVKPTAAAPAPLAPEVPLEAAMNFTFRSFQSGKKMSLSDFRGKTIILYFWDSTGESKDKGPTPAEKLFAIARRYDPQKVVLLLMDEGNDLNYGAKEWQKSIDPTPDLGRDTRRGHGPRLYPKEGFTLEYGRPKSAGDIPTERVVAETALTFYTGNKNPSWNAMRVTVINPNQQVVGATDFVEDLQGSAFEAAQKHERTDEGYSIYDFDEEALEDLLVKALQGQR